jgi:hypothetical protein
MSTTQIPDPVSVDNKVEVVTPNRSVLPAGRSLQLQAVHPGYQYQNPIAFRNNILSNKYFRTKYIDDVFALQFEVDPASQERAVAEPQAFQDARRNMEGRILNELYAEVSTGEEMVDAISRRGAELAGRNFNPGRIPDYIAAVRSNPENYKDYSVTDGKNLAPEIVNNPNVIGHLAQTDEEFRNRIYKDRFNVFSATLGQSHNRHGINIDDPNQVAKAFAIFENYGSEGLTRYVNYFQNYNPAVPLQEQDRAVQQAHAFFNSPDFDNKDPKEVVSNFIGSATNPNGQLTYQPRQLSMEVGQNVPLDYNNFTRFFDSEQSLNRLLSATKVNNLTAGEDGSLNVDPTLSQQDVDHFMSMIRDGVPTKKASEMLFDIMALGREGKGFSHADMFATIAVNATPQRGERGAIEYVFNPDELPDHARVAYEALSLDIGSGGAKAFRNAGDGMVAMEPDRQLRIQGQTADMSGYRNVNMQRMPVYSDNGSIVGYEDKFMPRLASFDYPNLLIGRTAQFMNDYMFTPMTELTAATMELLGRDDIADQITSSDWLTALREGADFDPYEKTSGFIGGGGGALVLTDLGMYIGSAIAIGSAAAATGGAALGALAGRAAITANSTRSAAIAGQFLQGGANYTRWQAQAMKTAQILRDGSRVHNTVLNVEIGAAVLESAGGVRRSMIGNPLIDQITDKVGLQTNVERAYAVSDNFTRLGMDALASVGVGMAFDNIWAGIKYGGNVFRTSKGKTARGLEWDPSIGGRGDYVKSSEAVFAPEWRRFLYDMTNGLQEMPLGSVAETQANLFVGRSILRNPDKIETLTDAMTVMNREMGDYFSTIRDDIDKTVRYWDEEFGGKMRYSDDQLTARVDKLYAELQDKIADGIVQIYRHQDPDKRDLVQFMAESMRNTGKTVQQLGKQTGDGTRYNLSLIEAHSIASAVDNAVVKEVVNPNGAVSYTVHQVDEGFWGVEMADALIRRYGRANKDDAIARNLRRLDIDTANATPEQSGRIMEITEKSEEVIGKNVIYGDQRGYITDFDARNPNIYSVRTIDGVEHKNIILTDRQLSSDIRPGPLTDLQEGMARQASFNYQAAQDPDREIRAGLRIALGQMGAEDLLRELDSGMPTGTLLARGKEVGVPETDVRAAIARVFKEREDAATHQISRIENDGRIKKAETRQARIDEQKRIIEESRDEQALYHEMISDLYGGDVRQMADDAFGQRMATPVQKLSTVYTEAKKQARKMKNDARLISGRGSRGIEPSTGPMREKLGLGSRLFRQLNKVTGGKLAPSIASARKVLIGLGSDNNLVDNIAKVAYNKGKIEPLRATDVKKHTAVVFEGDMWMARQGIKQKDITDGLAVPTTWIKDEHYGVTMNPYWGRTNRNVTIDPVTGELTPFVREGHGQFGPIYRDATPNDPVSEHVFLNIQQAVESPPRSIDQVIEKNIDGIRTYDLDGNRRFEVMNEADQAISVTKVNDIDPSFGLRSKEVKSQGIC